MLWWKGYEHKKYWDIKQIFRNYNKIIFPPVSSSDIKVSNLNVMPFILPAPDGPTSDIGLDISLLFSNVSI